MPRDSIACFASGTKAELTPQPKITGIILRDINNIAGQASISYLTSRAAAHDSGPRRVVSPYRVEGFHLQSFADLSRRSACPVLRPLSSTTSMPAPY